MSVVVVGLNHRSVPLEVLERMSVPPARLPKALADLRARDHVNEALILSTCMRTELYVSAERFHGALVDVRSFLSEYGFSAPEDFADHLYSYYEDAAVAHLFRVASGLDSAVVGEGEILGQVRDAWQSAVDESTCGPVLSQLFRHAVEVGKRVRHETGIARGTTSVSHAAVDMAVAHLGSLDGKRILVLGAGDMGAGMAVSLAHQPEVGEILVANRTRSRAVELAHRTGGRAVDFGSLATHLTEVDVLLCSTGAGEAIIDRDDMVAVMEAREGRSLLVVDVAMPRDVAPSARNLDGVTVLDLDDLKAFAAAGVAQRKSEIAKVAEIVTGEVDRYLASSAERQVAPLVVALRERAEALRQAELDRYRNRLGDLSEREREAVEAVTRGVLAKLLHEPTMAVKESAGTPRGDRLAEALRTLFDLA